MLGHIRLCIYTMGSGGPPRALCLRDDPLQRLSPILLTGKVGPGGCAAGSEVLSLGGCSRYAPSRGGLMRHCVFCKGRRTAVAGG